MNLSVGYSIGIEFLVFRRARLEKLRQLAMSPFGIRDQLRGLESADRFLFFPENSIPDLSCIS